MLLKMIMAIDNFWQVTNSPNLLTIPLYIFVFSCILQICEEFFCITNKDLLGTFRAAVEKYAPLLLSLYRARKTEFGKDLKEILRKLDDEVCAQYSTKQYFCPDEIQSVELQLVLLLLELSFCFFFFSLRPPTSSDTARKQPWKDFLCSYVKILIYFSSSVL